MKDFEIEIYPDEIAQKICELAAEDGNGKTVQDCEEALYQLKAIAENSYNSDFYRTLYRVLEKVVHNN